MKYAFLSDNSVQWFTFIVKLNDENGPLEHFSLDSGIRNEYLFNIYSREPSFSNLRVRIPGACVETFTGYWLSPYEFNRIKRMVELFPVYREYLDLGKL